LTEQEVLAVAAHELGHCYTGDLFKINLLNAVGYTIIVLALQAIINNKEGILLSFGFKTSCDAVLIFVGLSITLNLINFWIDKLSMAYSRKIEYQADRFAYDLDFGEDLTNALYKM